ncbi:hypothetical protein D9M73_281140 [compost metagenome]
MVHQHQVGAGLDRSVEQGLAGRDAADDTHDLGAPLHLQAIGAIILNLGTVQVAIGLFDQGTQRDCHKKDSKVRSERHKRSYNDRHYEPSRGFGESDGHARGFRLFFTVAKV